MTILSLLYLSFKSLPLFHTTAEHSKRSSYYTLASCESWTKRTIPIMEPSSTSPPPSSTEAVGVPEEKYNLVKKRLKEMTDKNESLTTDLNQAKKRLRRLAHEKNILLERICQHNENDNVPNIDIEDESMINNEINEGHHLPSLTDDTALIPQHESSKKDLHLLTDDESRLLQPSSMPPLSATLHPSPSDDHMKGHKSIYYQEKPPDKQHLDQLSTPHTPVPSNLRKDPNLPTLPSAILKHPIPLPHHQSQHLQHNPHPHHHNPYHHPSSSLSPPNNNGSTAFISCADYNSHTKQPPMEGTPAVSSPTVSSISSSTSSSSPSSINDTINNNNNSNNSSGSTGHHNPRPIHHQRQHHHHQQQQQRHSPLESGRNCTMVPSSRPKRMRRGNQEPKMRRVQPLDRDSTSGEYILPARVGILTVHSLGRVVPLTTYHNDRYIWPPGFKVSRTYLSMVNAEQNTVYTCTVEENGEQGPRFRVIAEDSPDQPIIANSATGVWTAIVKRANEIRNREHSNSASGPDYYGFTHATIAKMIQDLPGADQCLNYVWQKFGVMHQRTAAGVAAAAQKKLANLEIMGSANKRAPPPAGEGFMLNNNKDELMVLNGTSTSATTMAIDLAPSTIDSAMKVKDEPSMESLPLTTSQPIGTPSRPSISPPPLPLPSTTASSGPSLLTASNNLSPHQNSSSSILPSLATMTSTAAAAAAAVDIQQNEILNTAAPPSTAITTAPSSSSLSPSSSSTATVNSNIQSTSLQHHSLQRHHYHSTTTPSDITAWPTLSR
ncbi:F/Y rich C-terminus-domain-containing protein [Absidia repens]|uniref:F/Y rich C-terminus-domain-containing protein n=1 Tax=Absidia repens TaxID=90262 RepID=A0A1X2IXV7_9FUNG|nr:F/Y rich C-terminus-domain-containing protein [Absidia repens]